EHWLALIPRTDQDTGVQLDKLISLLQRHIESLADSATTRRDDTQHTDHNTRRSRDELAHRLAAWFRASDGSGIATLCHLGGLALQLERLRGDLAVRAALDGRSAVGSP